MVITKNSEVAKILKDLLKDVLTPRAIGEINCVSFVENKGIVVIFDNSAINKLYIKDETVDFTKSVNGLIVQTIAAALVSADEVSITSVDTGVCVAGKWIVANEEDSTSFINNLVDRPLISFTNEQYAKLEKEFELTVANYFSNQKNVDTIGFVNDEGAISFIAPGASLYKISHEIDATVDAVFAEQLLGHSTRIYLIPRRVYDMTKYFKDNLKIYLSPDYEVLFESDTVMLTYVPVDFGTNKYQNNKSIAVDFEGGQEVAAIKDIVAEYVDPIIANKFAGEEDQNIEIKAEDGEMTITIGNNISIKVDSSLTFKLAANAEVISYICKNYPNGKIKEVSNTSIIVKSENDYLIFLNNEF